MAIETHPAFGPGGSTPGERVRTGLAVLGGLVVLVALITLGYSLGSLMNHVHPAQPRQAGTLVHASAKAHSDHRMTAAAGSSDVK